MKVNGKKQSILHFLKPSNFRKDFEIFLHN